METVQHHHIAPVELLKVDLPSIQKNKARTRQELEQTANKPSYRSLKPFVFMACYEQANWCQLHHIIPKDINGVNIHTHIFLKKIHVCIYIFKIRHVFISGS